MSQLAGCTILLVEDDEDSRSLLAEGLARFGATVLEAASGAEAIDRLDNARPDIVISDLELIGMQGTEVLELVRRRPGLETVPAIALTGHAGTPHRELAFRAGFAKHLLKPIKMVDLVAAVLALLPAHEIRELLAKLNETVPCRFTSILRFADDDTLASMWTYDRENPAVDPFPLGLPIHASYCVLVRANGETLTIQNAATDPRTVDHPKRDELATYIGVPLRRPDGQMFGTLCSYDVQPVPVGEDVRATLEKATREIEGTMAQLFAKT